MAGVKQLSCNDQGTEGGESNPRVQISVETVVVHAISVSAYVETMARV